MRSVKSVFKTYRMDIRLSGLLWTDREDTIWTSRELTFSLGHHMKLGQVSRDSVDSHEVSCGSDGCY